MIEASPVLETRDLVAGYGKIVVVNRVSINLKEKEVAAILGPNGAGKTTLVKSIMGLVKVFEGEILYRGSSIKGMRVDKIVKMGIGYVPQDNNIFPSLTVQENLEMGAYVRRKDESLQADFESVFQTFPELQPFKRRVAGTLSGGERQMLAIARAMMVKPKLLILDEPTANLAPKAVLSLHKKIQEINRLGLPVLMVEQNAKKALEIADRAYVLVAGQCVYEGSGKELGEEELGRLLIGARRL